MSPKYFRPYDSLAEWINYSERDLKGDNPPSQRSSCSFRPQFTGVSTKEEAYKLLRTGYPEGMAKMKAILEKLMPRIELPSFVEHFENDISGCAPDISAYLEGLPENMFVLREHEAIVPPSTIRVQFELCFSCRISKEQAFWAGAIVLAAREALRMQGCNVDIQASFTVKSFNSGATWQTTFPIPSQCDMDTLSFLLGHPAMLRILCFSLMEHESPEIRSDMGFYPNGGYGRPTYTQIDGIEASINMSDLCNRLMFTFNEADLDSAVQLFQELVDTRFGTLQTKD